MGVGLGLVLGLGLGLGLVLGLVRVSIVSRVRVNIGVRVRVSIGVRIRVRFLGPFRVMGRVRLWLWPSTRLDPAKAVYNTRALLIT